MSDRAVGRRLFVAVSVALFGLAIAGGAYGQQRMGVIPPEQMTQAQKEAAAEYKESRNAVLGGGPYGIMVRTPEMLTQWHRIGMYLNSFDCSSLPGGRYRRTDQPELAGRALPCIDAPAKFGENVLGDKLMQFAILITMVEWNVQGDESHFGLAEHFGVAPSIITALVEKRRPGQMDDDEAALYDFLTELFKNKSVSDATYARALGRFGEEGLVDIVNAGAFYTAVGMFGNMTWPPTQMKRTAPR